MANREVNLTKRIWDDKAANRDGVEQGGYRYCPVAFTVNGRVKPDVVIINGQEEQHLEVAITSSGTKAANGAGSLSERMPQTQMPADSPRKRN
jgi:hypothetical protein